ncbi:MAG TPA: aldehyde-activating protein [Gammaproteobacteria bacterium]|nr:aldehyde-activating protein [Gammaproteobacteria bacterium]
MHNITGSCHCGNVRVVLALTHDPGAYQPRACDCSYCTRHAAAYISDAQGSLSLEVKDGQLLKAYRQGSNTADFLLCQNCGVLIGVTYREGGETYMAVNARILDHGVTLGQTVTGSPQKLGPAEKIARWKQLWFRSVTPLF